MGRHLHLLDITDDDLRAGSRMRLVAGALIVAVVGALMMIAPVDDAAERAYVTAASSASSSDE